MTEQEFIKRSIERLGTVASFNVDGVVHAAFEASRRYREIMRRTELVLHYAPDEDRYVCTEVPAADFWELLKRGKRIDANESLRRELEKDGYPV